MKAEMGKLQMQEKIQPPRPEGIAKEWEATKEHPTKVVHIDLNNSLTLTPRTGTTLSTLHFPGRHFKCTVHN